MIVKITDGALLVGFENENPIATIAIKRMGFEEMNCIDGVASMRMIL